MNDEMRKITLIGVPIEEGSGRRGAAMGPAALRIAGLDTALSDLGHDVEDLGDLRPGPAMDLPALDKARNLRQVGGFTRAVEAATFDAAATGRLPIILGGDHAARRCGRPPAFRALARCACRFQRPGNLTLG